MKYQKMRNTRCKRNCVTLTRQLAISRGNLEFPVQVDKMQRYSRLSCIASDYHFDVARRHGNPADI